jgi:HK97 gp10 family phage protein
VKVDNKPINRRTLDELASAQQVTAETEKLADDIARLAAQLAPVRTGQLARSIGVERVTDRRTGIVRFLVGWDKRTGWYGQFVERGGERRRPRPHLVPAAIRYGAVRGDAGV